MIQNERHGYEKRPHERHLHMREKGFRWTDENEVAFVLGREGVFQPEQQEFLKIKTQPEKEAHHDSNFNGAVLQLDQMGRDGNFFSKFQVLGHAGFPIKHKGPLKKGPRGQFFNLKYNYQIPSKEAWFRNSTP